MRARARGREQGEQVHEAPRGAFRADGSWDERATLEPKGPVQQLVEALVRGRRDGTLEPEAAARMVEAARCRGAFPSLPQWTTCSSWWQAYTATAAESCVVRAGLGVDGHWCAGRWAAGREVDCHEPAHRQLPTAADARRLVATVMTALDGMGGKA